MRRRIALAAGLPAAALAAVAAVVLASGDGRGGGPPPAAAAHGAGTEVVARRTLVDRAQLDGTLGYGSERPAMDRLGGTLTWLPRPGAVIRPGRRLFAVDGEPVTLLDGAVPAWRTLAAGVADGVDVLQLERGLAALGHDPGTVDASFTAPTAAAVRDWQEALGLAETGSVELGRVVFLPGPRRVAQVDATLGSSSGGGGGEAPAAWGGGAPSYAYAAYAPGGAAPATTPTTPSTTPTTPTTPSTTPTTPSTTPTTPDEGGRPAASGSPGSGDDGSGEDGGSGGGASATKVLTTTSTVRVVTADLDAADQQLARVGTAALVALPDGRRVRGRVIRVGTVVSDGGEGAEGGGDPTLPLTIRLRSPRVAGALDEAPVAVELARTSRRDVLAVPVAALIARPGGGYAVRVVRAAGASVAVPVQPGLFADGYVELRGGGVREGDRVRVPE